MNCDSCEEPKNSLTAAATGLALIISCGIKRLGLGDRQALLDGALDAHQADAEGVLRHLTDAADAAVAEVIDVVDLAVAVADVDQHLEHVEDVRHLPVLRHQALGELIGAGAGVLEVVEDAGAEDLLAADAAVELHAADGREVIALGVEEQVREQVLGRILGGRLAGTHHAVDLHQRLQARLGRDRCAACRRCRHHGPGRWCTAC